MVKKINFILALTLVVCLFTGCGSSKTTNDKENNDAKENVNLTLWGGNEDQELLKKIVDSFISENSQNANISVKIEAVSESACKDKLFGDLLNGADVFTCSDDQVMPLVAAGALNPVENEQEIIKTSNSGAIKAATVNDKLYAYPLTADNGYFMYYNKQYLSDDDVKTLDKILSVAAQNNKYFSMDWSSGWYLYSFFGNTGMKLGLNDDGITNYCDWNSTEGNIKGVDIARALLDISANPGFKSMTDEDFVNTVKNDTVIAGVSGVWNANTIKEKWGNNYGAVKLPTYTCANQQVQMYSFMGYKLIGVNGYSKNKEWSDKLAKYISNEKNQQLRFEMREQGPANLNAASSDSIKKSPAIQAVLQQSEYSSLQRVSGKYWDPVQKFGETMASGNTSGTDLQELMDTMVKGITMTNVQ